MDGGLEFGDAAEHAAADAIFGDEAEEAFDYIQQKGAIAAEPLAQALGWDGATARAALDALARLRLIRRAGTTFTPLPLP